MTESVAPLDPEPVDQVDGDGVQDGDSKYIVSLLELSIAAKVSETTIRKQIKRYPEFPLENRGQPGVPYRIDVRKYKAFIEEIETEKAEAATTKKSARAEQIQDLNLELFDGGSAEQDETKDLSLDEVRKLQAIKSENIRLAEKLGDLVSRSEVLDRLEEQNAAVRDGLTNLSDQVARRFNLSREERAELDEMFAGVLHTFARTFGELAVEERGRGR